MKCILFVTAVLLGSSVKGESDSEEPSSSSLSYLLKNAVFLPLVRSYVFRSRDDLKNPEKFGLLRAENFYIPIEDSNGTEYLGAWLLGPESGRVLLSNLSLADCLVIYVHGNSFDRGFSHRVHLYEIIQKIGCHVLTFDYRSYGDSTEVELTETSVVADAKTVLNFVEQKIGNPRKEVPHVIVWGHSLGTAVSSRALSEEQPEWVRGLVLESPFNSMLEEVQNFKLAWLTNMLLWWVDLPKELELADIEFQTEQHLLEVHCPVMVLHAEDDPVVPFELGKKLVESTQKGGKQDVELFSWDKSFSLRHRYIYRAPGIEQIVKEFMKITKNQTETNA